VKKPEILILDEATEQPGHGERAVDPGRDDRTAGGRTTFIIAHRLSTVHRAD
jgi:ATP-binding cassette subfamily B protein